MHSFARIRGPRKPRVGRARPVAGTARVAAGRMDRVARIPHRCKLRPCTSLPFAGAKGNEAPSANRGGLQLRRGPPRHRACALLLPGGAKPLPRPPEAIVEHSLQVRGKPPQPLAHLAKIEIELGILVGSFSALGQAACNPSSRAARNAHPHSRHDQQRQGSLVSTRQVVHSWTWFPVFVHLRPWLSVPQQRLLSPSWAR